MTDRYWGELGCRSSPFPLLFLRKRYSSSEKTSKSPLGVGKFVVVSRVRLQRSRPRKSVIRRSFGKGLSVFLHCVIRFARKPKSSGCHSIKALSRQTRSTAAPVRDCKIESTGSTRKLEGWSDEAFIKVSDLSP